MYIYFFQMEMQENLNNFTLNFFRGLWPVQSVMIPVKCEYKEQHLSENFIRAVVFFWEMSEPNGQTNMSRAALNE